MDLKECTGCRAMVDSQKAYCPDCGTPMDEEQRRESTSEFDNLAKTQNLNSTMQQQFLDNLNLSFIFAKKDLAESPENKIEPEKESFNKPQVETKKESSAPQFESKTESFRPTAEPVISKAPSVSESQAFRNEKTGVTVEAPATNRTTVQTATESWKKLNSKTYLLIGLAILALIVLFLLAVTIAVLGFIYYWQR